MKVSYTGITIYNLQAHKQFWLFKANWPSNPQIPQMTNSAQAIFVCKSIIKAIKFKKSTAIFIATSRPMSNGIFTVKL